MEFGDETVYDPTTLTYGWKPIHSATIVSSRRGILVHAHLSVFPPSLASNGLRIVPIKSESVQVLYNSSKPLSTLLPSVSDSAHLFDLRMGQ